jgi:predicted nuclease of restriction endonuclease-like (RecB) superfamily
MHAHGKLLLFAARCSILSPMDTPGTHKGIETSADYRRLLETLKERVAQAQLTALKAVNRELIALYWDIGRTIVEKQEQLGWGESIVAQVARDLQSEFPGVRGFSRSNVFNMRRYYLTYRDDPKVQTVSGQIPWSHNTLILDTCKAPEERAFYLEAAARFNLSYRTLNRQIRGDEYQRYLQNQTNFPQTLPEAQAARALLAVKDDYNLDFLGLADEHTERELEDALVHNITRLLQEMGGYFTFAGRQVHVEVDGQEYFVDLLFYHRKLKALVAVELKAGPFQPEYAGKMQFYLSALDDQLRLEDENPSIGIIVCRDKSRTMVEYTLRDVARPIGISTYNRYSSLDEVPERIAKYLPSPDELDRRLSGAENESDSRTDTD